MPLARHLMQMSLGRTLRADEHVHHKNHDHLDDRVDNLEIKGPAEHARHHTQKHPSTKPCGWCGVEFTPKPTKRARAKGCSPRCWLALRTAARRRNAEAA